jgi:heme exporter protein A
VLAVKDLHVFRGERHVLRGVSFRVAAGYLLQVTGPNGCGKTTLLRSLCGLVEVEQGEIQWRQLDFRRDRADFVREMTYLGHDPGLKADMTGAENVAFLVALRRAADTPAVARALARTGATSFGDRPVRTLSAGQRRRIALAALWLLATPLWVLDEPTTNLDEAGQQLVAGLVGEHLERGGIAVAAVHQPLGVAAQRVQPLELAGAGP